MKLRRRPAQTGPEDGFTLLELMVTMAVMAIVLVIAGSGLISLQGAAVRNDAMITDEQAASTALALMARDIRSAHSIEFLTSTTDARLSVILNENQPSSTGTTPVEWVYQPGSGTSGVGTLSRVTLTSSLTVAGTDVVLTDVSNPTATPVFSYFNLQGVSMDPSVSGADQTLQNCTTSIGVDLMISPSPVPGVTNFQETDTVAITDQEQILSAPGNGQCGTAP